MKLCGYSAVVLEGHSPADFSARHTTETCRFGRWELFRAGAMGRIGSFWVEKGRCGHCGHPGPSLSSPGKRCIIWPCRRNIKIMVFFGRRWGGCITTRLQKANRTGQAKAGRQSQLRPGPRSTHLFGPKPVWYSRSAFVRTWILKELCPRLSF